MSGRMKFSIFVATHVKRKPVNLISIFVTGTEEKAVSLVFTQLYKGKYRIHPERFGVLLMKFFCERLSGESGAALS